LEPWVSDFVCVMSEDGWVSSLCTTRAVAHSLDAIRCLVAAIIVPGSSFDKELHIHTFFGSMKKISNT
jgi:hypothetical protein